VGACREGGPPPGGLLGLFSRLDQEGKAIVNYEPDPRSVASINPFPPAAVANCSAPDWVSIATQASDKARKHVEEYVAKASELDTLRGRSIAIVGDFGTGKTHLALEMLRYLDVLTEGRSTRLYVDAPGEGFLSLYKNRFLPRLDLVEVRQRVLDYYSDVVIEELSDSEIAVPVVDALRAGTASVEKVVESLALAPTRLHKRLATRLSEATQQPQFAAALTLFLRPEYEAAVWQWLSGGPLDAVLEERGIAKTIDSDVDALEAIGVVAILYGLRGRRFALVLDELEKILVPLAEADGGRDVILSLKQLIQIFNNTGALLILCGLPDYFDLLPMDTRERLSDVIEPTRLSDADTRRYIEECQRKSSGVSRLAPFADEAPRYIANIAAGNARRVIRLCYLLYRESLSRGVPVTRALIRQVAKENYETSNREDVSRDLVSMFDRRGWLFERDKRLAKSKGGVVDFWLPVGREGSGCAVVLTDSLLDESEGRQLGVRASQISGSGKAQNSIQVMAVVNGRISEEADSAIAKSPLRRFEYGEFDFADTLETALAGVVTRLEESRDGQTLDGILDRIGQLDRQMASLRRAVDSIGEQLSSRLIQAAAEAGLRRLFSTIVQREPEIPFGYRRTRETWDEHTRNIERIETSFIKDLSRLPFDIAQKINSLLDHLRMPVQRFERDLVLLLEQVPRREHLVGVMPADVFRRADSEIDIAWRGAGEELLSITRSLPVSDMYVQELRDIYKSWPEDVWRAFEADEERLEGRDL
jgi:hypothetical protein